MSKRYLVTGGAGFIGSHIVRRLVSEGAEVRVVDNLSTGQVERLDDVRESVDLVRGDLANQQVSEEAVQGIDCVLHQAAVPSVRVSVSDPVGTNRANVTATINLLESCRKAGVRRVVYAASSSAYGDTQVLPKTDKCRQTHFRLMRYRNGWGEHYCKLYHSLYELETVSLRYFNVFGPAQDPHSEYSAVIPKFINAMGRRKSGGGGGGGGEPDLSPSNPKYQTAIRVWQRLPVPVTKVLGPMIVRNIP